MYGSVAEFVGKFISNSGLTAVRMDEFFALVVACRGILAKISPVQRDPEPGEDAFAIHERFGAQVALLQSPIPRTAKGR
jgi:hypothetical protein